MAIPIVVFVLTWVVTFLAGEIAPLDKHTKRFKRLTLVLRIAAFVLLGVGALAVWLDRADLEKTNARLHHQLDGIQSSIEPITHFLNERFPGKSEVEALAALRGEMLRCAELATEASGKAKGAEERARNAEDRAAHLETRAAPRHLSPTAKLNVVQMLSGVKGFRLRLIVNLVDSEAMAFAGEIKGCFVAAGWIVDDSLGGDSLINAFIGCEVNVKGEPQDAGAITNVVRALNLAGLNPKNVKDPTVPEKTIRLYFGSKE